MLIHNYNHLAGKTVHWDTSDNETTYKQNLIDNRSVLERLEYIDYSIDYQFNSEGFRSPEFNQSFDILCFGCSFTFGTGLKYEHTWPAVLGQITNMSCANLGHPGSSNDTVFRFADYYLAKLKPKYAIWLQTDSGRLEIINGATSLNLIPAHDHICAQDNYIKFWVDTEYNQEINLRKNTLAFEKICDSLSIKSIIVKRDQLKQIDLARDLSHPGPKSQKQLAELISVQL